MKFALFRSIQMRIMAITTLLIVAIVGAVIWMWTTNEKEFYQLQKRKETQVLATTMSNAWLDELVNQNWTQIRLSLELAILRNPDALYLIVSDARLSNQIVAAIPSDLQEQYIPDVVRVDVTQAALEVNQNTRISYAYLLRDIRFPDRQLRGQRGEVVMEVSTPFLNAQGDKIGTLRLGVSQRSVNLAVRRAMTRALGVGVIGLTAGFLAAFWLSRELSIPVRRLQMSAVKIASGHLEHRAKVDRDDEIGALARAFNSMADAVQMLVARLQLMVDSFQRFVPEKFLLVIASEGIENIQVGVAAKREIAILFADIRGYTSMSEQLTPLETFELLNDYLSCMGHVIDRRGGFIDKYIGDAIMALFDEEASDGAVQAALEMREALEKFNQKRSQQGLPTIDIGIGIHRGEVVMGTVGFTSRIESTVVGDAVNVAARVEGLTKNYGSILITHPVVAALRHPENFPLYLVDQSVKVKGKDEPVAIYSVKPHNP